MRYIFIESVSCARSPCIDWRFSALRLVRQAGAGDEAALGSTG